MSPGRSGAGPEVSIAVPVVVVRSAGGAATPADRTASDCGGGVHLIAIPSRVNLDFPTPTGVGSCGRFSRRISPGTATRCVSAAYGHGEPASLSRVANPLGAGVASFAPLPRWASDGRWLTALTGCGGLFARHAPYVRVFPPDLAVRLLPDRLRHGLHDRSRGITTCGRSRTRRVVAKMGPVSQRASMGNGARGLQCQRRRVERTSRTTRRGHVRTAGVKTASRDSATKSSASALRSALWNGRDPILKERLFGLTNAEGNHGEDVKEYYFYLDATPTHSYMKWLYKYPQRALPVSRSRRDQSPALSRRVRVRAARHGHLRRTIDIRCGRRIRQGGARRHSRSASSVTNRGPEAATLHVLPTLWFRNTWRCWPHMPTPSLRAAGCPARTSA